MLPTESPLPARRLPEWYVISLRPRGRHAGLRRAATRRGAGLIALSPWALQDLSDATTRALLQQALGASRVLFTSPAAVLAARRLQPFGPREDQHWIAVGSGTAAALRRAGVQRATTPARMDSEGLLALPALQDLHGVSLGLITAPGGRGILAPALQARGATLVRADVYQRVPLAPAPRALSTLRSLSRPAFLALSSGEALRLILTTVPDDISHLLRAMPVVASSERLALLAGEYGFGRVVVARSARPFDLLAAAVHGAG